MPETPGRDILNMGKNVAPGMTVYGKFIIACKASALPDIENNDGSCRLIRPVPISIFIKNI